MTEFKFIEVLDYGSGYDSNRYLNKNGNLLVVGNGAIILESIADIVGNSNIYIPSIEGGLQNSVVRYTGNTLPYLLEDTAIYINDIGDMTGINDLHTTKIFINDVGNNNQVLTLDNYLTGKAIWKDTNLNPSNGTSNNIVLFNSNSSLLTDSNISIVNNNISNVSNLSTNIITLDNIDLTTTINNILSTYKILFHATSSIANNTALGLKIMNASGGQMIANGTSTNITQVMPFYIKITDYPTNINGKTPFYKLVFSIITNNIAPTTNYTLGLYPISTSAGTVNTMAITLGTLVTSSSVSINAPAPNTQTIVESSLFTIPSSNLYLFGVNTNVQSTSYAILSAKLVYQ